MKKENDAKKFDAEDSSKIIENENLKSTLREDFGATLSESDDIPPEIENQFLTNMIAYENAYKDSKQISVYDFIGKPEFKLAESLDENEISFELKKIVELLAKHFIALDCICKYPDEVIYKFITQELFFKEIDDIRLEGFWCNYIYEEFHPNHEYDIKQQCEELIRVIFSNDWRYINACFCESILINGKSFHRNNLDEFYCWFLDQWKSASVTETNITEIAFDEMKGHSTVRVLISNEPSQTTEQLTFKFKLIREFDWWSINSLDIEADLNN